RLVQITGAQTSWGPGTCAGGKLAGRPAHCAGGKLAGRPALKEHHRTMKIGILGGTGKEGAGLGLRWASAGHEIVIGSRDPQRAQTKAQELAAQVPGARVSGASNPDAAAAADVVVLALPANGLGATLPEARDACQGKVVVSTVVPLTFGGGRLFT